MNDFCELLAKDVESIFNFGKYEGNNIDILHTFGYPKVDIIVGSDHGQGKSRFLMKANLLSSKLRREKSYVEYGSRQYLFANIACRKDTNDIHKHIAPYINSYLDKLKNGKLVGIYTKFSQKYYVAFLPKNSSHEFTSTKENKLLIHWTTTTDNTEKNK